MAILLDGKKVAQEIAEALKQELAVLKAQHGRGPVLACVKIGENPAASVYVKSQIKSAEGLGVECRLVNLPGDISQHQAIAELKKLNDDKTVTGIIIQTPLPRQIDANALRDMISVRKDAEGVTSQSLGLLVRGQGKMAPCTAAACVELLRAYQLKLYGKEVVIVGHSEIVGKPLSLMLLKEFATTTVCHIATSQAQKLADHVRRAEILIVAVGQANLIKGDWIKQGATVIDVGINRVGEALVGDVEFEAAAKKAAYITPVPGGVGPLTVMMLMKNCSELFKDSLNF